MVVVVVVVMVIIGNQLTPLLNQIENNEMEIGLDIDYKLNMDINSSMRALDLMAMWVERRDCTGSLIP